MAKLYETAELEAELFEDSVEAEDFSEDYIEDLEDLPALELTLELADGRILEYELGGVFVHDDREYAALHPKTDTEGIYHLMELAQGEDDDIKLLPVADEDWEAVSTSFYKYLSDEPYEHIEDLGSDFSEPYFEEDIEETENYIEGE